MLLGEKLVEVLRDMNILNIHIDKSTLYKLRDSKVDYFQWLSIMILENKVRICIEPRHSSGSIVAEKGGVKLVRGAGSELTNVHIYWRSKSCQGQDITWKIREKLKSYIEELKNKIIFIIDVSFWHEHTEIEKRELIEQIVLTIKSVRKYLHDSCLAVTSCCDDFLHYFHNATKGMRHSVVLTKLDLRTFIKKIIRFKGNILMLDPEGEFTLSDLDVRSYNVYIMGGIIDKERTDKFGTYRLYNMYRLWEFNIPRFKIALNGSIVGVPDRLNKIAEIIMETKLLGKPLDKAVIEQQSKRDRVYRWLYEIQKLARKVRVGNKIIHIISEDIVNKLRERYPLDEKSIQKVFKSLNVIVEGRAT